MDKILSAKVTFTQATNGIKSYSFVIEFNDGNGNTVSYNFDVLAADMTDPADQDEALSIATARAKITKENWLHDLANITTTAPISVPDTNITL